MLSPHTEFSPSPPMLDQCKFYVFWKIFGLLPQPSWKNSLPLPLCLQDTTHSIKPTLYWWCMFTWLFPLLDYGLQTEWTSSDLTPWYPAAVSRTEHVTYTRRQEFIQEMDTIEWFLVGEPTLLYLPTLDLGSITKPRGPLVFSLLPPSWPSYLCSVYGWIFCTMMSESSTPRRTPIWRMNIPFSLSVSWLTLTSKMISTRLFFLGSGKQVHQSWL